MESNTFEPDWASCEYCYVSYQEYDIGYKEYGCNIWGESDCCGGSVNNGCPLAFKYVVEE